jgi:hypothetical protein
MVCLTHVLELVERREWWSSLASGMYNQRVVIMVGIAVDTLGTCAVGTWRADDLAEVDKSIQRRTGMMVDGVVVDVRVRRVGERPRVQRLPRVEYRLAAMLVEGVDGTPTMLAARAGDGVDLQVTIAQVCRAGTSTTERLLLVHGHFL